MYYCHLEWNFGQNGFEGSSYSWKFKVIVFFFVQKKILEQPASFHALKKVEAELVYHEKTKREIMRINKWVFGQLEVKTRK